MKRALLLILSLFLLTAQAEGFDSPLVHAEEMPLAVDISSVITFQTDETGVFAVVTVEPLSVPLSSSEELMVKQEAEDEIVKEPASFLVTTHSTPHSITYRLTPIGENP